MRNYNFEIKIEDREISPCKDKTSSCAVREVSFTRLSLVGGVNIGKSSLVNCRNVVNSSKENCVDSRILRRSNLSKRKEKQ